jgi:hypothetical protein
MNATNYFTEPGLHALIRNPKAVRSWPQQRIPAFTRADLPDSDIDAVIAYLLAKRRERRRSSRLRMPAQ